MEPKHHAGQSAVPKPLPSYAKFVRSLALNAASGELDPLQPPVHHVAELACDAVLGNQARSTSLSRARVAPPATPAAAVPKAGAATTTTSGSISAEPGARTPSTAAPPYATNRASEALDLRSIGVHGFSLSIATWHTMKAQQRAAQQQGRTGVGRQPLDPYECTMEHVAWCLTASDGVVPECRFASMCSGRCLKPGAPDQQFTLRVYASDEVRRMYESKGVWPELNEAGQPHSPLCIIDMLAVTRALIDRNIANHESSTSVFPPFYNPTGHPGTYATSALCSFSSGRLTGLVYAFRDFHPDQFVHGRVRVACPRRVRSGTGSADEVYLDQVELPALIERRELVEWRAECEVQATRGVHYYAPPRWQPPTALPDRPPLSSGFHTAEASVVSAPRTTVERGAREQTSRKAVAHMLPELPAPVGISTALEGRVAEPSGAGAARPAAGRRVRKRSEALKNAAVQPGERPEPSAVRVKREPIEEPVLRAHMGRFEYLLAAIEGESRPKN